MIMQTTRHHLWKIAVICLLSFTSHYAFSECRFNPEGNKQILLSLAKKQPGSEIYLESNSVVWENGELAEEIYYGGCDILKFKIKNTLEQDVSIAEEEAFEIAKAMALLFWQKEDAYELSVKLTSQSFNREDLYGDKTLYQYIMNNPDYAEMTMMFDRIDNTITIEWIKE